MHIWRNTPALDLITHRYKCIRSSHWPAGIYPWHSIWYLSGSAMRVEGVCQSSLRIPMHSCSKIVQRQSNSLRRASKPLPYWLLNRCYWLAGCRLVSLWNLEFQADQESVNIRKKTLTRKHSPFKYHWGWHRLYQFTYFMKQLQFHHFQHDCMQSESLLPAHPFRRKCSQPWGAGQKPTWNNKKWSNMKQQAIKKQFFPILCSSNLKGNCSWPSTVHTEVTKNWQLLKLRVLISLGRSI